MRYLCWEFWWRGFHSTFIGGVAHGRISNSDGKHMTYHRTEARTAFIEFRPLNKCGARFRAVIGHMLPIRIADPAVRDASNKSRVESPPPEFPAQVTHWRDNDKMNSPPPSS